MVPEFSKWTEFKTLWNFFRFLNLSITTIKKFKTHLKKLCTFAPLHFKCRFQPVGQRLKNYKIGDVAQLARALGWQPRGRRFEPDLLHKQNRKYLQNSCLRFLFFNAFTINVWSIITLSYFFFLIMNPICVRD